MTDTPGATADVAPTAPQQSTVNVNVSAPAAPLAPVAPAIQQQLQPINVLPPKSSRTFSKYMVGINCTLAWGAVFYSIMYSQPYVALGGFAMVAILGGQFMGIGHKDLALLVRTLSPIPSFGSAPTEPTEMQEPPPLPGEDNG